MERSLMDRIIEMIKCRFPFTSVFVKRDEDGMTNVVVTEVSYEDMSCISEIIADFEDKYLSMSDEVLIPVLMPSKEGLCSLGKLPYVFSVDVLPNVAEEYSGSSYSRPDDLNVVDDDYLLVA